MDDNEKIRRLAAYVGMRYEEAERFVLAWYLMKTIDADEAEEDRRRNARELTERGRK